MAANKMDEKLKHLPDFEDGWKEMEERFKKDPAEREMLSLKYREMLKRESLKESMPVLDFTKTQKAETTSKVASKVTSKVSGGVEELSIEQKAKAYDEAIDRAKEEAIDGFLDAVAIDTIFPELKKSEESKDEKIRKNLISLFQKGYGKNSSARFAGIKIKDIIAWLEKQGEQKPTKVEPTTEL